MKIKKRDREYGYEVNTIKHLRKVLEGFNDSDGNLMNKGFLESFSKIYSIVALRMHVFFFIRESFKIILRLAWKYIILC